MTPPPTSTAPATDRTSETAPGARADNVRFERAVAPGPAGSRWRERGGRVAHLVMALLLAAAGGIHLVEGLGHLPILAAADPVAGAVADWGEGTFFLLVAAAQLVLARWLAQHPSRLVMGAVVALNLAVAATWAVSRTVGLPVGSLPGVPDVVTATDAAATAIEVLVATLAAGLLLTWSRVASALRPRRNSGAVLGIGVAAAVLLTAVGPLGHSHSDGEHHGLANPRVDHRPDLLDPHRSPEDPLPGTRIPVGDGPEGLALAGDGTLLVGNRLDGTVSRIDLASGRPVGAPIPVGKGANRIAVRDDVAWVTLFSEGAVARVVLSTGQVLEPVEVGALPYGIVAGHGSLWVANSAASSVSRIDPATGRVEATIATGYGPLDVEVAGGWVWVLEALERRVTRIDPATNRVVGEPIPVGGGALDLAAGFGRLWIASSTAGTVTVVDSARAEVVGTVVVDRFPQIGGGPDAVAVGAEHVWVANNEDRRVVRIDPRNLDIIGQPIYLSNYHAERIFRESVLVVGESVFITDPYEDAVVRLRVPRAGAG